MALIHWSGHFFVPNWRGVLADNVSNFQANETLLGQWVFPNTGNVNVLLCLACAWSFNSFIRRLMILLAPWLVVRHRASSKVRKTRLRRSASGQFCLTCWIFTKKYKISSTAGFFGTKSNGCAFLFTFPETPASSKSSRAAALVSVSFDLTIPLGKVSVSLCRRELTKHNSTLSATFW